MATDFTSVPDFVERKGSLYLRSDHMNYSRATLNSNWHQARESEPKDYDISKAPERDLCKATYGRIGNVTSGELPQTTYQDHSGQIFLKKDFQEQETRHPMINPSTFAHSDLDSEKTLRETGAPDTGFGSILPRHHAEHNKRHLQTTNKADFKPPFPYTPAEEKPLDFPDNSVAYKKCHSQFTDHSDYRRPGRNTWQDESGLYSNSHYKEQVFKPTNTIPERLE